MIERISSDTLGALIFFGLVWIVGAYSAFRIGQEMRRLAESYEQRRYGALLAVFCWVWPLWLIGHIVLYLGRVLPDVVEKSRGTFKDAFWRAKPLEAPKEEDYTIAHPVEKCSCSACRAACGVDSETRMVPRSMMDPTPELTKLGNDIHDALVFKVAWPPAPPSPPNPPASWPTPILPGTPVRILVPSSARHAVVAEHVKALGVEYLVLEDGGQLRLDKEGVDWEREKAPVTTVKRVVGKAPKPLPVRTKKTTKIGCHSRRSTCR